MRGHEDPVMLCSTTGSYGRFVIEVAYGEILFHSTETVWELVAWEEWLGYRHDALPMLTYPDQHQCGLNVLFFGFLYINLCMCVLFSKSIYSIKENNTGDL